VETPVNRRVATNGSGHHDTHGSASAWMANPHRTPKENRNRMGQNQPLSSDMLKGTLDMMILRTLSTGDAHGHTIAKVIERTSEDVLEVEQGSLYPALHRLEDRGWLSSYWGASENNRKAKYYRLTAAGRRRLTLEASRWRQMARAIALVMGETTVENVTEEGAK
jgi:PadR family transcriptional regulator, regulatory protein PadR